MSDPNNGRFVWYELMTSDPKAAISFYEEVIGWKTQAWEGGEYTMFVGSQGPLGGTMKLPEEAKKMGAPPHWTSNVQVADVDATVALARKHDARIYVEPNDIPKIGRFAVIADPQGASINVFKGTEPMTPHDGSKSGEFTWSELLTTNQEGAMHFYGALFGWEKMSEFDMGPMGKYFLYGIGGKQLGGIMTKPKDMPAPSHWMYYVEIAGLDAAIARAKAKGAKLLNGPMEVPGGARIAQLQDPQGAAFALHEISKKSN
jgi:predicted enzyme related to lactoylglutathione lyase